MGNKILFFSLIFVFTLVLSCKPGQDTGQSKNPSQTPEQSVTTSPGVSAPTPEKPETAKPIIETVEQKVVVENESSKDFMTLGVSYAKEGRFEEAIETYKHAIQLLESDAAKIYYNLAYAHIMVNDETSAFNEYKHLRTIDPVSADMLYEFSTKKALADQNNRFFIQIGAYKISDNAEVMLEKLKAHTLYAFIHKEDSFNKVRLAGLKTMRDGKTIMKSLNRELKVQPFLLNHQH